MFKCKKCFELNNEIQKLKQEMLENQHPLGKADATITNLEAGFQPELITLRAQLETCNKEYNEMLGTNVKLKKQLHDVLNLSSNNAGVDLPR